MRSERVGRGRKGQIKFTDMRSFVMSTSENKLGRSEKLN